MRKISLVALVLMMVSCGDLFEGPRGPRGWTGQPGAPGPAGEDGLDGLDGVDGVDGTDGQRGPQGSTGPSGPQGGEGPMGPQGGEGPMGPQGPDSSGTMIEWCDCDGLDYCESMVSSIEVILEQYERGQDHFGLCKDEDPSQGEEGIQSGE